MKKLETAQAMFAENAKFVVPSNSSIGDLVAHLIAAQSTTKKEGKE